MHRVCRSCCLIHEGPGVYLYWKGDNLQHVLKINFTWSLIFNTYVAQSITEEIKIQSDVTMVLRYMECICIYMAEFPLSIPSAQHLEAFKITAPILDILAGLGTYCKSECLELFADYIIALAIRVNWELVQLNVLIIFFLWNVEVKSSHDPMWSHWGIHLCFLSWSCSTCCVG